MEKKEKLGKQDIVKEISARTGTNIQKCTQFCDVLEEIVIDALIDDKRVLWGGFLDIEAVQHNEVLRYDPNTKEKKLFPPTKSIKCKMSKSIRDIINER